MDSLPMASIPPVDDDQKCMLRQIFDPESRFITNWNRFELLIRLFNVFIDPLFFYLPLVISNGIQLDLKPAGVIILLRLIGDSFYLLGIIVKFRTAYVAPCSRVPKKRELVKEPAKIAIRYLKSVFLLDLFAILPLPQVYLWYMISTVGASSDAHLGYYAIPCIVTLQIIPRLAVMFSLKRSVIRSSGLLMKKDWSGAATYLLFYIMLSHMAGAVYYSMYIFRLLQCKEKSHYVRIEISKLDWDQLLSICSMKDELEQGMISDAYERRIGSRSFSQRYMYCFSWGLKCLSSMAQNFNTGVRNSETVFSFFMNIFGLLLFAGLIAQMQTSIQALDNGEELQMVRLRDIDEWTKQHQLPPDLRKSVRQSVLSEWRVVRGLDDEALMDILPLDVQCEIRRHLHMALVSDLPFFANMDGKLVHSFCGFLRAFSTSKGSFIAVEGEPVGRTFLIVGGQVEVLSINGGCSTPPILGKGDICGQELISWASFPSSSTQALPLSSRTFKCLTDVEAFFIPAKDLKLLALQFDHLWNLDQIVRL